MKILLTVMMTAGLCFALQFAKAQSISGQVLLSDGRPAAGASLTLSAVSDTITVKSVSADSIGKFRFSHIAAGKYRLRSSLVGFAAYESGTIELSRAAIDLPVIRLKSAATELKEVSISARTPAIEQKIDRVIVNVNSMISNSGANALEALQHSPGVTIEENGQITLNGKTGVLVLIDDKPTYLSASDLATYLKTLPAAMLDKIELMDNPPARYDAAGNGGAINIRTKKLKSAGLNGNLSASYRQAEFAKTFESLNLNYRDGKVNFFANAAYNDQHSYRELNLDRSYFTAGLPASNFQQTSVYSPVSQNPSLRLGADIELSKQTTVGFVLSGSFSPGHDQDVVGSAIFNPDGRLDSAIRAVNTTSTSFNRDAVNLNYSHQFDRPGTSLNIDLDEVNFYSNSSQQFINTSTDASGNPTGQQITTDRLPVTIHIYSGKVDYSRALPGKARLDAGIKSSYVNTNNTADYFDVVNGVSAVDDLQTNQFLYQENINAAYLNVSKETRRFSVQAGLRAENTNNRGQQAGNAAQPDSLFSNHYTSLFPTAYFLYKLDTTGNNALVASYGRRIGRPYYQDLNPFIYILDKFTYFSGNPFLKPQFSSNYQLSWRFHSLLTVSAIYNHATDIQNETITQQGNIFVSRTGNIGSYNFYGLTANLQAQPVKWCSVSGYLELSRNRYVGALYQTNINSGSGYIGGYFNSQFFIGKTWTAELSGDYSGPHSNAQFTRIGTGRLNAGIQKKMLNNKGSVRLAINDMLHSYSPSGTITGIPGATSTYHNTYDSRYVALSFSYAFGGNKKSGHDASSAKDESDRVKH